MATAKKKSAAKRVARTRLPLVAAAEIAGRTGKPGRPEVPYHPDYDDKAITLSIAGFTQEKMADVFGVSLNVFLRWMDENDSFLKAVRFGIDQADALVERSLFKCATGYVRDEVEVKVVSMGEGQGSEIVDHPVRRWYPPNSTAQVFYLANRQRSRYKRGDAAGVDPNQTPDAIARAAQAAIAALGPPMDDDA